MRFVASTLLDAVRKAETPASAALANGYLCILFQIVLTCLFDIRSIPGDFLSILSEIERNYL